MAIERYVTISLTCDSCGTDSDMDVTAHTAREARSAAREHEDWRYVRTPWGMADYCPDCWPDIKQRVRKPR